MKDIIIEATRRGGRYSSGKPHNYRRFLKDTPEDDIPNRIPNRWFGVSQPNDNLRPLRKFLHSRVGRRWDDVYSEIRAVTDYRNLRGNHLLEHVFDYVRIPNTFRNWYPEFYVGRFTFAVDENGILRRLPQTKHVPKPKPITRLNTPDKNVWYEYFPFVNHDGKKYSVEPQAQWYRMERTFETHNVWKDIYVKGKVVDTVLVPYTREVIDKKAVNRVTLKKIRAVLESSEAFYIWQHPNYWNRGEFTVAANWNQG